jgi:hypothetical protein
MLQLQTVSPELLALTKSLMNENNLNDFRLVGGTALALQLGHRQSIDIDLFSNRPFNFQLLREEIILKYSPEECKHANNGVSSRIHNIQVDIVTHEYPWLKPPILEGGIRMASIEDIAAMKMNATSGSGNRQKDFVDLYILLEKLSLNEISKAYQQKYPNAIPSIGKTSVGTFDHLKAKPKIKLLNKTIPWYIVKKRLKEVVLNPNKIFKPDLLSLLPKKNINPGIHKRKPKL